MIEYGTSRAAAWDCPVTVSASLEQYRRHPRTEDNLEIMRRWEDVRARRWLTEEQKQMLRDPNQEHILLVNEKREYELVPYEKICGSDKGCGSIRAFLFERGEERWVVYWHCSEEGMLKLPLKAEDVSVCRELYEEAVCASETEDGIVIPVGNRRYLRSRLSKDELVNAFSQAQMLK